MKKYPFVKQRGLKDCGPACILMILKYYGGYISLDKLSDMLCTNNKGTTAYHMVEVLKSLGFDSEGYKYKDFSLIKCPCIALINIDSYNHYVVIYEINFKKKYLIIGDPSKGIIKMNFDEFLSIFTGVIISMTLKRKLIKEKEVSVFKFLFKLIKPNIKYLIIISFLSLIISIASIFSSFFIQAVIMNIHSFFLMKIILLFSFLLLFIIIAGYVRNLIIIKINQNIDRNLSINTFSHIIYLPYCYCKNKTTGEISSYFSDLFLIKNVINNLSITIFINIPLIILLAIFLFFISYQFFIINMFTVSLYLILYLYFKNKNYYLTDSLLRKKAFINSYIVESIKGYETIRNIGIMEKRIFDFENEYIKYLDISKKFDKIKNTEYLFREIISNLNIILIIFYGTISIRNGFPIEMFITIFLLSNLFNSSFKSILEFDFEINEVKSSIEHIGELFIKENRKENILVNGDICIKNLNYSFNKVDKVLNNINLNIKNGTKLMVSGQSGSGKSTLFKIVKGYYDDYDGNVCVDGKESNKFSFKNVLYVSPREILFTGRIIDNLFNFKNNEICELDEFVDDYNMLIEEDGFNISDGQRQRIVLARALTNFNVLIIDEGLSQVDINMERRILKRLFKEYTNKTIIYISHRFDNLDLFDRFLKLDKGKVVLDEVRS
ncbi:MAG: ATP-binding cassette domain-containing protein [Bacilli bacterium]|nr:ATP-binding cassette domain-containing protein [Bacilli bacterium]